MNAGSNTKRRPITLPQGIPNLLLAAITGLALLFAFRILTSTHSWGDDYIRYLLQSESLLTGSVEEITEELRFRYEHTEGPKGSILYPWGYPLLMLPWMAVFGLNLFWLKLQNLLYLAGYLICVYLLARKRFSYGMALGAAAIAGFHPVLIGFQDHLLSDTPFLFFSTLSLLLLDRNTSSQGRRMWIRHMWLGGVIGFAFSIRTNGILLLAPVGIAHLAHIFDAWKHRNQMWRSVCSFLPCYLAFGMVTLTFYALFPEGSASHVSYLQDLTLPVIQENIRYYKTLTVDLLAVVPGTKWLVPLLALAGMLRATRNDLPLLGYMACTYALYIIWPFHEGFRFLFPVLPLWILFAARGFSYANRLIFFKGSRFPLHFGTVLITALAIGQLLMIPPSIVQHHRRLERSIHSHSPASIDMFSWVQEHTPEDAVIAFHKTQHIMLYAQRRSVQLLDVSSIQEADYLIEDRNRKKHVQLSKGAYETGVAQGLLELVFDQQHYRIYRVIP